MSLTRDGVKFIFWINYHHDPKAKGVYGKFKVGVPRGKIVQWDVRKIQAMLQPGQPIKGGYYPHSLTVWTWNEKVPDEELTPPVDLSGTRFTSPEHPVAWYVGGLGIEGHLPDTFYLKIPKMKINDTSYPPFTIKFHKAHGLFWGPINGC